MVGFFAAVWIVYNGKRSFDHACVRIISLPCKNNDASRLLDVCNIQVHKINRASRAANDACSAGICNASFDVVVHLYLVFLCKNHNAGAPARLVCFADLRDDGEDVFRPAKDDCVVFLYYKRLSFAKIFEFLIDAGGKNTHKSTNNEDTAEGNGQHCE